ncbi:MAG: hypothetical protein JWN23_1534 [Rhodocyclales bacterium]|nr:hypothetical protein [Rhodocyclales bacterium]
MPIDAGLLTALPVSGSSTDYASVLAQQSGAPADVVHAILGTEQSAPNATSVDNARGRMQVTPAAWSQYGLAGVDFSHATPDQLDIAGAKKLADDYKWSGGNPQITAAAYFGGRGGATLFAQGQGATRQDGNGFNINQYVDRFNQKFGSAPTASAQPRQSLTANTSVGQTAADVDAARQRAKGATLGDALKEVLASGTSAVGDIAHAGGEVLAAGVNAATGLPDYSGFNPLKGTAESIRSTMTPGGTAAREDQATGDLDPATWQFPKTASGWVMSAANTFGSLAPALIPMIGPAARAAKLYEVGSLALKTAQAAGDIEGIAAAQKVLSEAGSAGMQAKALSGAVEGGMTGGNAAEGARDDVRQQLAQMTHDERMQKIPAYAKAFQHYGNDNDASNAVTNSAAQFAGMFSATAGAAGGVFNEKVIEDLIAHKGVAAALGNVSSNRAVRTVVGAAAGHAAEAGQEGLEQLGQNVGENVGIGVDPLQNAGKDMFPNMLGGALIGTPMGAVGGLTSHGTHAPANGEIHPDVAQNTENVSQNIPPIGGNAIPVAQNAASVSPPATSLDELSQQRDQVSARIAMLQDVGQRLQGTQSQAAVENEIVGLQQQQRALGEQMQAAVSTGAANPGAAPAPVNDPEAALQTRARVITDFVADKSVSRELRQQDPQAWGEFLRAYRVALNPTMNSSLRLRALDGIDGYLQQQGFKTSAQGAYERLQQAQPTPANIVPYGANQAELQRGDPQGRMVVDAQGNARPASINDVPQPDPNVVQGQVISSSEGPAPVAPLRADANGVVGTANDFTQLRQQEAQAAVDVKRNAIEEALRPRALPVPALTDAQAASLKQPSALVQEIRAFRLKNSPAKQVDPAATAALTQENENDRKTQAEDQTQANAAPGKAETNALLTPEATNAVTVDEAAHQAASSPLNALPEPTEAQKHAGNYPMGHIRISGMDISIENPQGSVRSGTDANGKAWSNTLAAHYGYLRGTVGKDKDHIDVFVKPATAENHDGPVFVIDQRKPGNGHLDEHKVMMGFANEGEARKAYQDSYQKGWDGIRAVTEMSTPGFKDWIANGDHTKPAADYRIANSDTKPTFMRRGDFWNHSGKFATEIAAALETTLTIDRDGAPMVSIPEHARADMTERLNDAGIKSEFTGLAKQEQLAYSREVAVKTLSSTYANKGADAAAEQFKQIIKDNALSDGEWKALRSEFRAQIQPSTAKSRADASFERQNAAQRSEVKFSRAAPTDSEAFKRWFGDSKVVDANGKPLVVYHGTAADFATFKAPANAASLGAWFTSDSATASRYSEIAARSGGEPNVMPAYLSLRKPATDKDFEIAFAKANDDGLRGKYLWTEVRNLLEKRGHDGLAMRGTFVAFEPTQIKSAIGNRGTFDTSDADIRHARDGASAARDLFASPNPQSSVEDVRGEITGEVGDKAGKVHVVQSITDLPTEHRKDVFESKALDLQGLFDPKDGSIYLVADNITKGEAFAVLMHEAGVHLGMRELIGDDAMGALAKQIKLWSALEKGTEHGDLAARAMQRIPEETDPAHREEELIAYFVTEAVKAGHGDSKQGPIGRWFAKLWAAVKAAVAKLGADPSKLTTADVVAMARGALERSLGKESAREGEPMSSAKPSELRKTPIVKDNRVNATFTALAKFDEAFQQPTPTATDPVKLAKQIDPGFKVEKLNDFFAADWKDEELPQVWQINSPRPEDGKANLYDDGRRVWIDVSGFKAGESQGNLVYGIAAAYAHNNGKVFIGDPMGLSPVAFFRRLENMISSALRYGTTDHLAPHAAQTNPEKYFRDEAHNPEFAAIAKNFALDWKAGDFAHNLKAMLTTSYNAARYYVPELEHLTYDFDRREFVDTRTGAGRSGIDLARIFRKQRGESGSPARYFGGSSTAARAALFNTLVQGTGKEGWSGTVAALSRQLQGDGLDPALKRIFYSRAGSPDDVKPGRAARIEAIINRGAKALPEKLRTQVTEDSTRQIIGESNRDYTPAQREFFANTGRDIETPTLKAKIKAVWQDAGKKVAQGLVDQFAPIKDISEKGYMLARLSKGAAGAFQALLDHGKLSVRDGVYDADQSGGVVERLFKPLQGEGEDFLWWVAANRAERLTGEGRENLFSSNDIAAGKSLDTGTTDFDYTLQHDVGGKSAGTVTRDRTLIYRDSAKVLDEFNRNVMDVAEQSGLIDGEARHIWEHDFYVPFYRVSDEDGSQNFANVKSGLVRQQAFKQLKGGSDKINADIMSNVMSNWAHLIDASAKNRAAQETLSVAESMGIAHKAEPGEKNTVWYQQDGNKVEYKVDDPYLMTAINSLAYSGLRGPMMNAMGAFKHALTVGVTASPFFKVRNLIRDSLQAISTSGLSYNAAKNIKEGFKASDRKAQSYVSLLASGGIIKFGTMLEGKESARVRRLVKSGVDASTILDSQNKLDAFYAKYIEPAMHAYHELGDRGEEINRAALYQQLVAQGVDHAKAAYEARDLMDFSMQGSWASIRLLTQVVPFMNARLQGLYKLGRAAKDDPRKLGIVLGSVALASIGLMLGYKDDDDWKKREDWDRDNYWWFKLGGEAFRIPKPFEIGAIGSLAERGVELFVSDEMTKQRFMDRFTSVLSDNLSMNPIPQLVKPILDVYANKNGFTGRPIETMGMERMRPQDRYNSSTSMIARGASTASNALTGVLGKESLSPVQIDELIRGYFGWLGTFVLSSADQLARPASGEPARPTMDYAKTLSGGMVASLDGASSRYVSQMYDQARTLEEAYGSWKQMLKEGKVDDAADYYANNAGQLALYKHVEHTKADAAKLNQQLRAVENSDAPADEKREQINRIRDEQDQVARRLSAAR